ncbi:MAG: MFS transporter [Vampirovibrionales bacterium]|nr:MFS transporter [Vampirovibrionales bacterium]
MTPPAIEQLHAPQAPVTRAPGKGSAIVTLAAGLLVMTALGVGYGWSLFVPALIRQYDWTHQQAQTVFGALIAIYSLTMIGVGPLVSRWGPKPLTLISAGLFIAGMSMAAASGGHYLPTLAAIGGLVGVGVGFGYVTALTTCIEWFPNRKGAIAGLVAAGFGGGPMLMTLTLEPLLTRGMDVLKAFEILAIANGAALLLGALLIRRAAKSPARHHFAEGAPQPPESPKTIGDTLKKPAFWTLFVGMLADTFTGFLLIGAIKPMGLAFGFDSATAAAGVLFLALGNCAGRFVWGLIADRFHARSIPLSLGCLALAPLSLLMGAHQSAAYYLGATLTGFCFGAAFSVYPSQIASRFGLARVATLYPLILIAQAMSAILGPPIGGWIIDHWNRYDLLIALAALSSALGLLIVWILDAPLRRGRVKAPQSGVA